MGAVDGRTTIRLRLAVTRRSGSWRAGAHEGGTKQALARAGGGGPDGLDALTSPFQGG